MSGVCCPSVWNGVGTAITNTSAGSNRCRPRSRPRCDHAAHEPVEIDFLDMDRAAVDRVDHRLADVDAMHLHPARAITAAVGRPI